MENFSFRINLKEQELEISGDSQLFEKFENDFKNLIEKLKSSRNTPNWKTEVKKDNNNQNPSSINEPKAESFGEYYSKFPRDIKDVDKILIAGYFSQLQNENNIFSTNDASTLLVDQGVKLSNPSAFLNSNLKAKKVFKHNGNFRISELGIEYLKEIVEQN